MIEQLDYSVRGQLRVRAEQHAQGFSLAAIPVTVLAVIHEPVVGKNRVLAGDVTGIGRVLHSVLPARTFFCARRLFCRSILFRFSFSHYSFNSFCPCPCPCPCRVGNRGF